MESTVRFAGSKWFFSSSFRSFGKRRTKKWKTTWTWHAPQHPALYNPLPPPMTISPRVTMRTQAKRAMVAVAPQRRMSPQNFRRARIFWLSMVRLAVHFWFFRGIRVPSDFCSLVLVGSLLKNRVWKSSMFQIWPPPTGHHDFAKRCAFNHPK